jgi:tight adherence protein B
MSTSTLITLVVALAVGIGLAFLVVGLLTRVREREDAVATILEMPYGESDVSITAVTERDSAPELFKGLFSVGEVLVRRFNRKGSLAESLERARIFLKPGEYVILSGVMSILVGLLVEVASKELVLGLVAFGLSVFAARGYLAFRIKARVKALEAQLPDALSLIAASLSSGHTFLRAIQMMCEEAEPPLSEEFGRVVAETRLGDPLIDALERMAQRVGTRDLLWVVQAIRIQQSTGGRLADLLHSLAEFIRGREEVRREVRALTAEGRLSAIVLGVLPVGLLFFVNFMNPGYEAMMFRGWGLVALAITGGAIAIGVIMILRMSQVEV